MTERDAESLMEDFPGNANRNKKQPGEVPPEKKVEKVVTGEATEKKKPFGTKLREVFVGGEFRSASSYIAAEVLLPALRNLIVDVTSRGIERVIYGENAPRRPMSGYGNSRVQYNTPMGGRNLPSSHNPFMPGRANEIQPRRNEINDIILLNRSDAEAVIEHMTAIIDQWQYATVADLKELAGLPATFIDNNWGWSNPNCLTFQQCRDGWLIRTTNPEQV